MHDIRSTDMKSIAIAAILILAGSLCALTIGDWQNIRFSGKNAAGQVFLRTEIAQEELLANNYLYNPGSGVTEYNFNLQDPATLTYQGTLQVGSSRRYLGLKKQSAGSVNQLVPVFYEGTGLPALTQLTTASTDALNDNSTNYYDIAADYVTFTDTKFCTAIQNRGGGFPTSASFGTVYPSYMSVIAAPDTDPNDPNVTVWALAYMSVPLGGISPGLFKITGTGTDDLVRIGNIETNIVSGSNLLIMSCNIADLLADPDFAAWYNTADPVFGMMTLINKTTVIPFATTNQDQSPGALVRPRKLYVDPTPNTVPWMDGSSFLVNDAGVFFTGVYHDAEGNFPLTAEIEIQGGPSYPLLPQSLDYTAGVLHSTEDLSGILAEYDGGQARTSVSDDDINFQRGEWFSFTYILGLLGPEQLSVQISDGNVLLAWAPVTQTLLGNPVAPDLYRVEASATPDFADYQILGISSGTSFSFASDPESPQQFYRVVAVKYTS